MSLPSLHLVLLETSGNQDFIFSTNKLRDAVGGSELIHRVGTTFLEGTLNEKKIFSRPKPFSATEFQANPKLEPPFFSEESGGYEVLLCASGKALILVRGEDKAKALIQEWSRLVLEKAPGLDAFGVFFPEPMDKSGASIDLQMESLLNEKSEPLPGSLPRAVQEVHALHERYRSERQASGARFQRLPPMASCQFSGLPAGRLSTKEETVEPVPLSHTSLAKVNGYPAAKKRLEEMLGDQKQHLAEDPDKHEKHLQDNWVGVFHADGNGLGNIFLDFAKHLEKIPEEKRKKIGLDQLNATRRYIHAYRSFSCAIDRIATQALKEALNEFPSEKEKIVPLIAGGDDFIALLDGMKAIPFARRFLASFQKISESDSLVAAIAHSAHGQGKLGIAGGLCLSKAHFPFTVAYHLAEDLIKEAKEVKKAGVWATALDFHILYDSSESSLEDIRGRLKKDEKLRFTAKPFVLDKDLAEEAKKHGLRPWEEFKKAVEALQKKDKDCRPLLPNSQAHQLREMLRSESWETLEKEWTTLCQRYSEFAKAWPGEKPLFIGASKETYTYFLDALEAKDFLEEKKP